MPTPVLMPSPRQRFFDNIGLPLVRGYVFTFAAGTSTKLAAYQDAAGLIPHENPIRLDDRGEATIYWLGNYKVDLRTAGPFSSQVPGYPVDNFNAVDAAAASSAGIAVVVNNLVAGGGSSLVGFKQAGVGASVRTLQDKSREVVSITDFGADRFSTDNAAAIDKAITYMMSVGGILEIPQGDFKTSGSHVINGVGAGGIVSITGKGPAASRLIATGDNAPLTINGASECFLRSFGVDKTNRNQAGGDGIKITNTAYALVDHVTAYGFLNGIKTEAVLTTLFNKTLTRFCDIGMYLARGPASCPNAITLQNCSSSLNNRFGLRVDEGATITVSGGSIEGNGWGAAAAVDLFRGGVYLSNCGTEGGVAVTISGVQMEQNLGKGDIHIATTKNAGTVYNIFSNTIFPIDNTHFTDNAIYVENNVEVTLNVFSNSFRHIGTYTPNAARKYIKTEAPSLLTVNTCGDSKQFFSAIQTPDLGAWGPNVYRGSMSSASASVNNGGAASIAGTAYNIGVVTRTGVGTVVCTFVKPMLSNDYRVSLTPSLAAKTISWTLKSTDFVTVETRDLTGTLVDSGFDIVVSGGA